MEYIDTHAHLNSDLFSDDRDMILDSAVQLGVRAVINCATGFDDWEKTLSLSRDYPLLKSALGVHPWYIPDDYDMLFKKTDFSIFRDITAVGEIGLDKKFSRIPIDIQKKVFTDFIILAKEFNLPATVHCISAFDELIEIIKKTGPPEKGIVLHAFNGSSELAASLIKYNIYFSIGGTVTYPESRKRNEMIKKIFPERMMLETDSPDIPVAESTDKRNVPGNIIFIAKAAALILNEEIGKVAAVTTDTARRIFGV
ncbi:MAG: TatD family hydrolase [Spirochaetes bacterium]|nr:TatD family hydrolase [Spirochaetota bacterium]